MTNSERNVLFGTLLLSLAKYSSLVESEVVQIWIFAYFSAIFVSVPLAKKDVPIFFPHSEDSKKIYKKK